MQYPNILVVYLIVLSLFLLRVRFRREEYDGWTRIQKGWIRIFQVSALFLIIQIAGCESAPYHRQTTAKTAVINELASLGAKTSTEGSFFLGCGNIFGSQYYYYCEKYPDGAMSIQKALVSSVLIYEDSDEKPFVGIKQYTLTSTKQDSWMHDFFFTRDSGSYTSSHNSKLEFHVPKGTVKKVFDVDVSKL
jgi:hypothetical protein